MKERDRLLSVLGEGQLVRQPLGSRLLYDISLTGIRILSGLLNRKRHLQGEIFECYKFGVLPHTPQHLHALLLWCPSLLLSICWSFRDL